MTIRLSLRQEQIERERKFQGHWVWLVEGPTIWVGSWSSGRSHENPPNLSDHARGLLLSLNRQCNLNYTKLYDSARFTTNAGVLSRAFSDPGFVEPLRRSFKPKRGLRSILTWRVVFSGPSTVIETQLSWLSAGHKNWHTPPRERWHLKFLDHWRMRFQWTRERVVTKNSRQGLEPRKLLIQLSYRIRLSLL